MSRLNNGILGGLSGKVSGVVGGNWKGINYIRAYAKPSNPKTTAQTIQRSKFNAALSFAKALKPIIQTDLWEKLLVGMSGFNAFMRRNISLIDSNYLVNANNLISEGSLESLSSFDGQYDPTNGSLDCDWSAAVSYNGLPTDSVSIVVYDNAHHYAHIFTDATTRSAVSFVTSLPVGLSTGGNLVLFAYCSRVEDNTNIYSTSNSVVLI